MRVLQVFAAALCVLLCAVGCAGGQRELPNAESPQDGDSGPFDENTRIDTVRSDPVFDGCGKSGGCGSYAARDGDRRRDDGTSGHGCVGLHCARRG